MRQKVYQLVSNPLIFGSAIVFIGSFVGNLFNFLFNFFMSRNLSVADYGTLASLVSLVVLATMPAGAVLPMLVKFAASYFANNEIGKIKGLYFKVGKVLLLVGIVFFASFVIFSQQIAGFFNINETPLVIIGGSIVLAGFLGTINLAFLQGKLLFNYITFVNLLGISLKLIFGLLFVFLGFKIYGAMWGFAISYFVPFLFGLYPLKFIFHKKTTHTPIHTGELFSYGAPAAVALFALTSFISTDIMLVKHFFSPNDAGKYALLSLIGRVIYFLTASISTVMFPMVVQKYTRRENYTHIFILSVILVALPSIFLTIFYFLFPEFVISIFNKNTQYLEIKSYLGLFALFISLYSLLAVLTNFFLSINKTKIAIPIAVGAIAQIIFIWFFHSTFAQIIGISLAVVSLLLISLLIYYLAVSRGTKKEKS